MMKKLLVVIAMIGMFAVSTAKATLLGEVNFYKSFGASSIDDTVSVKLFHDLKGMYHDPAYDPIIWQLTEVDVGSTLYVYSSNPSFDECVDMFTNGEDDAFWTDFRISAGGAWLGYMESSGITKYGVNGVDFAGYIIESIALTVNQCILDSPGDSVWTNVIFDGTISIYGVPEPTTIMMFGLGGLLLRRRRR